MRGVINILFLLLLALPVSADLADYPSPFVTGSRLDALIIVGDDAPSAHIVAATEIITRLQEDVTLRIGSPILASEAGNMRDRHLILIGDGCVNSVTARLLNESSCGPPHGGRIRWMLRDLERIIIIDGSTAEDVRLAARVLATHDERSLSGEMLYVTGTLDAPRVSSTPTDALSEETACASSTDCRADEFCSDSFGCLPLECPAGFHIVNHACARDVKEPPKIVTTLINETKERLNISPSQTTTSAPVTSFFSRALTWFLSLF